MPFAVEPKGRTGEKTVRQQGVLVIDLGSARPVDVWVADGPDLGKRETALALYQVIWHPGALDWPLRGIPEIIQVDASLAQEGLENIKRAAHWLGAEVQVVKAYSQKKLSDNLEVFSAHTKGELREYLDYTVTLIDNRLVRYGAEHIHDAITPRAFTPQRVQDALRAWFRYGDGSDAERGCFPDHRSPEVPLEFRQFGLTMPGFDSPAAGLLLPVVAEGVSANSNAVLFNERRYSYLGLKLEQSAYAIRCFPYRYKDMPDSLFIEDDLGRLNYLVAENYHV